MIGQKTARQVSRQVSITSINADHQKSMDIKTSKGFDVVKDIDLVNTSYERVTPQAQPGQSRLFDQTVSYR